MASKPAAAKPKAKAAAKSEVKEKVAVAAEVPVEEAGGKAGGLKLRALVDRVVEASGAKKKDAKPIVEATLAEIDRALAKGEGLNLPSLGKLRVVRLAADGGGAMTLKLRKPAPGAGGKANGAKEPLAAAED